MRDKLPRKVPLVVPGAVSFARNGARTWGSSAAQSQSVRRADEDASYLAHWLGVLRGDKRVIFSVAAHAQRAVDFLRRGSSHEEVVYPRAPSEGAP